MAADDGFEIEGMEFDSREERLAFVAMCLLNTTYSIRQTEFPSHMRAILSVRINDAIKRGLTDPTEIAMDALRAEGISASYKVSGEIGYIVIDDDA